MKKLALLLTVATFAITSCNETKPAEEAVEATAEVATDAAAAVVDTAAATAVVDSAAAAVAPATK
ncbi:MAG: hypothetical protein JNL75_09215 [Chitinophagales bacterium]|nr:hypothetical protein [Chitinophagales bacterium]